MQREDDLSEVLVELRTRLDNVDTQLIRVEHRFLPALGNLLRHGFKAADAKRMSAWLAFAGQFLRPSTAIVAGGGIVAWLTLAEIGRQTEQIEAQTQLLERQTKAVEETNEHFQRQIEQDGEADYRIIKAALIATIYNTEQLKRKGGEDETVREDLRALQDAVQELAKLESGRGRYVDLSYADLRSAYLYGADLSNTNLLKTNLAGANLTHADLSGSALLGTNLSGANLTSVTGLTARQVKDVLWDELTIWPEGLTPPDQSGN